MKERSNLQLPTEEAVWIIWRPPEDEEKGASACLAGLGPRPRY